MEVISKAYKSKIEKLEKKNFYKNIVITILAILLIISILLPIIKENNLKENLDYNSKYKLNLKSVYGDLEAYHPKVISFEQQWNGYYYWMSYTPYPNSDEQKENPHVVASNDMINWETPKGLVNPLDDVLGDDSKKYNSDSHLTFNNDLNRLECYWRYVDDEKNTVTVYRKYSSDGINWSEKESVAFSENRKQKEYVSPAIIYEDGVYKIWYVDNLVIKYAEAKNGETNWKEIKKIDLEYPKTLKPWHLDIIKTDNGYEMLLMAFENWKKRGIASLYHTSSKDNENWEKCREIIKPTSKTNYWDNRGIYRSSMIKKNGTYYVFYSASDKKNIKGIGIMYGKDINSLKSTNIDYINDKEAAKKFEMLTKNP